MTDQEHKQERIAAVKAYMDASIEALVASGRLPETKRAEAESRVVALVAKMEAANVYDFIGADYFGDAGVQRLIKKFR